MIRLEDKETGAFIGTITEDQLEFLKELLEEESADDHDYYINRDTIDTFEKEDADPSLVELLRDALGPREEMEIQWTRHQ